MEKIFTPINAGKLEMRNRIMRSATWDNSADNTGAVTDNSRAVYHELGKGGIGLIVTGYAFVAQNGQVNPGQYGIYSDEMIPGWQRITEDIHNNGGKIAMQIVHGGVVSNYLPERGVVLQVVSSLSEISNEHRKMSEGDIERVIDDFVAAGLRVREAGFDAVQLHGAHGLLMSQCVSPLFNQRTDKWGGNAENRRRFHLEVIRRLRQALGGDYPILIKFGVQDDNEGGLTLGEGVEIARMMEKAGIDGIEISAGIGTSDEVKELKGLEPAFRQRAAAVKQAVGVPVAVVSGIRKLETAIDIIESGDADIVSMSRPFIREPQLVLRWEKGDREAARCVSCNKCRPIIARGEMMECGEERRLREAKAGS